MRKLISLIKLLKSIIEFPDIGDNVIDYHCVKNTSSKQELLHYSRVKEAVSKLSNIICLVAK